RLVVARSDRRLGTGLHPAVNDCAALRAGAGAANLDPCGMRSIAMALVTGHISARGFSLRELVGVLSRDAGRPLVDQTGLTGTFDIDLTWTPQVFRQGTFNRDRFPSIDPDGPALATALQEQLGLKLQSSDGTSEALIIDAIEPLTPN